MWHTNCGDRTLEGAEARLFAGRFVKNLKVDSSSPFGVFADL